jgi:hypothetical protein
MPAWSLNMQAFLDARGDSSFSVVNHLRWDLVAILDLALSDGVIPRNQARQLHTPTTVRLPNQPVMTPEQVTQALGVLDLRERLFCRLAIFGGMRPGEIIALRWTDIDTGMSRVDDDRYYKGKPGATRNRKAHMMALSESVQRDLANRRPFAIRADGFVFESEAGTPIKYETSGSDTSGHGSQRSAWRGQTSGLRGVQTLRSCERQAPTRRFPPTTVVTVLRWRWRNIRTQHPIKTGSSSEPGGHRKLTNAPNGMQWYAERLGALRKPLKSWSGRRESDPQPTAWKAVTLPLSYSRSIPDAHNGPSACALERSGLGLFNCSNSIVTAIDEPSPPCRLLKRDLLKKPV